MPDMRGLLIAARKTAPPWLVVLSILWAANVTAMAAVGDTIPLWWAGPSYVLSFTVGGGLALHLSRTARALQKVRDDA